MHLARLGKTNHPNQRSRINREKQEIILEVSPCHIIFSLIYESEFEFLGAKLERRMKIGKVVAYYH